MENYEVIGMIGKGNFGTISKIRRIADKKILVWKELNYGLMSDKEKQQIVSEVNILRELRHPNIIRYYDRIIDKKLQKIYIIMEYCQNGDLNQLIKKCKMNKTNIAEDMIWKIFSQIVLAIHYIHNFKEGKILHRDIKPSNIFLDSENNIKLGDFGLSRELGENSNFAYSHVGTPYYMSPEQIDEIRYNEKSDIWSLGCFLYEISYLNPPFLAKNQIQLAMKIKNGKIEKTNDKYSNELFRVISWMLSVNPENRPSSDDLLNIPEISIRLREKRIKETIAKIKSFEENLKIRENQIIEKEKNIENKLNEINNKENILNNKEKLINEKEINIKIKENELNDKEKLIEEKEKLLKEKEKEFEEKEKNFNNIKKMKGSNISTNYSIITNSENNVPKILNNDLNSLILYNNFNNNNNNKNEKEIKNFNSSTNLKEITSPVQNEDIVGLLNTNSCENLRVLTSFNGFNNIQKNYNLNSNNISTNFDEINLTNLNSKNKIINNNNKTDFSSTNYNKYQSITNISTNINKQNTINYTLNNNLTTNFSKYSQPLPNYSNISNHSNNNNINNNNNNSNNSTSRRNSKKYSKIVHSSNNLKFDPNLYYDNNTSNNNKITSNTSRQIKDTSPIRRTIKRCNTPKLTHINKINSNCTPIRNYQHNNNSNMTNYYYTKYMNSSNSKKNINNSSNNINKYIDKNNNKNKGSNVILNRKNSQM